jgi:hypothetical protein
MHSENAQQKCTVKMHSKITLCKHAAKTHSKNNAFQKCVAKLTAKRQVKTRCKIARVNGS